MSFAKKLINLLVSEGLSPEEIIEECLALKGQAPPPPTPVEALPRKVEAKPSTGVVPKSEWGQRVQYTGDHPGVLNGKGFPLMCRESAITSPRYGEWVKMSTKRTQGILKGTLWMTPEGHVVPYMKHHRASRADEREANRRAMETPPKPKAKKSKAKKSKAEKSPREVIQAYLKGTL